VNAQPDNALRIVRMRELLTAAFSPQSLQVTDDSHRHFGHAGARDGRGHFTVEIVSDAFAGMTPLARHRAIYAALGEMMSTDIHALSMRVNTPPVLPDRHEH
jgi:BolA protein